MKITAALCILACVVASVQSAAPANCKDEVAYANKWEYTGTKGNAACKKYMACPMQHEKMVPQVKQCKRLTYFDPTSATCSSKYKCPVTEKEKTDAKVKTAAIKVAEDEHTPLAADTAAKKTAMEAADKASADAVTKAATDAAALVAADKAVSDKEAACKKETDALKETAATAKTDDTAAKEAVETTATAAGTAKSEYDEAKVKSDESQVKLDTAKAS